MGTFETIGDVVDNAIELHRQAAATYRRLRDEASDTRIRMLLSYMVDHQAFMESAVAKQKQSVGEGVLGTYIQFSLDENPRRFLESKLGEMDSVSLDDLEHLAVVVDDYLVDLFEEALQEMDSPSVTEFLSDLLELERLERRKLTLSIDSMMDM